jgi:hypothetical protein
VSRADTPASSRAARSGSASRPIPNRRPDKASAAWCETLAGWEAKLRGETDDAERRLEAARDLAQARGFRYLPVAQVAQLPLPDLLARVEAIRVDRRGRADLHDGEAVLGAVPQPKITVSRALELYWTLARDKTIGKSQDQIRRWENPRKKAIANFVKVCGDLPIDQLSADDMTDFSDWWLDRIENEDLTPNSANKEFMGPRHRDNFPLSAFAISRRRPAQLVSLSYLH